MVNFSEEKKGYNKEQVDGYVKILNTEYEKLTKEHQELVEKTKEEKEDTSYADAIAAVLVKSELTGKQIIKDAQFEAQQITEDARFEAKRMTRDAQLEAQQIVIETNQEMEQMLNVKQTTMSEIKTLANKLSVIISKHDLKEVAKAAEEKEKESES